MDGRMTDTETKKPKAKQDGDIRDTLPIEGVVAKGYVPEGFDTVEDFLQDMREEYQADVEFDRINREQALDDKKFAAGEQWDPVVLEQRKGLPCLVINNIPQFTAQLVGDWRESRKSVKVVPSNDEDVDIASIRGDLIRSIEMQSRADRVYDGSFESLVQCGDGAFRISVEYARDSVFDQDIFIRPIEDCLAVVWDRMSVDITGRDAKRVFVDDRIPKKEFKRKWPEITPTSLMEDDATRQNLSMTGWIDDNSYRVTEYWRLIERQRIYGLFENGKVFAIDGDNMDELIAYNGAPVKTRLSWCTYAQMHLVTGFAILDGPYEYQLNRLPIIRMSGRTVNIGGRRVRYGLVRFMKDPVRLKNFWRSVNAEQLGYAPKAQWIGPESAFEGREDTFRKAHLSRDPLLIYNDDAVTPPERVEPPQPYAAYLNEAQVNSQDMKDVTGIHDASLGVRSNEVSGRAIQARQREGDIASLTFFDNGNAAVLEGGDVINQLIPQVMDGTRVARLVGEDQTQRFVRLNDPMDPNAVDMSVGQYDVALSTGTSYSTRRVEAAQAMMDAIQVFPALMTVAGPEIIRAQDWPGADKIAEKMEEARQQGMVDPEQFQQLQQELQKLQQENLMLKVEKKASDADRAVDKYNAETQRIRALSDHEVDANDMEMNAIQMILDGSKSLDEHDLRREEFEQKRQDQKEDNERQHKLAEKSLALKSTPTASRSSSGGSQSQSRKRANG
jgi:hypothetical protein